MRDVCPDCGRDDQIMAQVGDPTRLACRRCVNDFDTVEVMMNAFNTTVTLTISDERVRGLLVSALEGGSNYWYRRARPDLAPGINSHDFMRGGRHAVPEGSDGVWSVYYVAPFLEGCALLLEEYDDDSSTVATHRLDRAAIQRGLDLMANDPKVPRRHFNAFLDDNADAETGDVFLQLAAFGEIKYG